MKVTRLVVCTIFLGFLIPAVSQAAVVTFSNKHWGKSIRVEVRIGDYTNPERNPFYGSQTIPFGKTWKIQTNGTTNIWYRWGRDFGSSIADFGSWIRKTVYGDNNYDITI